MTQNQSQPSAPTATKPADNGAADSPDPIQDGQPDAEGFVLVNTPLEVYQPTDDDDLLQGYVLNRVQRDNDPAFYVVQLTRERTRERGAWQSGQLVAVLEDDSNKVLSYLRPQMQAQGTTGVIKMLSGYEVVLKPQRVDPKPRRNRKPQIVMIVKTRRVGANAEPALVPPPSFPIALG